MWNFFGINLICIKIIEGMSFVRYLLSTLVVEKKFNNLSFSIKNETRTFSMVIIAIYGKNSNFNTKISTKVIFLTVLLSIWYVLRIKGGNWITDLYVR